MGRFSSLSVCARITLDMHNLNNEGTEGNQQQTRMVHIIDQYGERAVVNAISGDMFKHILVEHLVPLLHDSGQPLSEPARRLDPDRITADAGFISLATEAKKKSKAGRKKGQNLKKKGSDAVNVSDDEEEVEELATEEAEEYSALNAELLTRILTSCSLTDIAGALYVDTALPRKSCVEFGWVTGIPSDGSGTPITVTEQYFHVKYAAGRGASAGGETTVGQQAIFHRPASSGVYAVVCNLDLHRIGLNDITRAYVISEEDRETRARALIMALAATLLKPAGAQRNTQNPHIVDCQGVVAVSHNSLPAPTISPLHDQYREQIGQIAEVLNRVSPDAIEVHTFDSMADGVRLLTEIAYPLQPVGV